MRVLGIETSCDETAAAVVEDGHRLLSSVVASSVDLHAAYGGVVPEIAARSHLEIIIPVIEQALHDAIVTSHQSLVARKKRGQDWRLETRDSKRFDPWDQIDAIAVTQGPGLLGSLLIGVLTARTLAIAKNKPLYAVNHVQAHPYAAFLTESSDRSKIKDQRSTSPIKAKYTFPKHQPEFPILALIVSGGHTQLVLMKSHSNYTVLGQTTDDAVGEAFDKVAKMLGLPYPGGPSIAEVAAKGDPKTFKFPKAKLESKYDFSFSGLKTAVLRTAQELSGHDYTFPSTKLPKALSEAQKTNIAASFQRTVIGTLVDVLKKAEEEFQPKNIVIAGGVAANQELRKCVTEVFSTLPTDSRDPDRSVGAIIYPDIELCTDNAAMVATLGYFQKRYYKPADPYTLEASPGLSM